MIKTMTLDPRTIRWNKMLVVLLILALLATMVPMPPTSPGAVRVQPELLEIVAGRPYEMVRVIVQKLGATSDVEGLVERLDGAVIRDLHIINAIAAELPGKAVGVLARAAGVRWISLDAPVVSSAKGGGKPDGGTAPPSYYLDTLRVREVWDLGYHGEGIGVAVVDSGVFKDRDFTTEPGRPFSRIAVQISFNENSFQTADASGHGTHVAGIVGGNGGASDGLYVGVAPKVDLINLKISDDTGMAYESDTVEALQWVLDHKDAYNIRVVNLSINSTSEMSYHDSPLDAAVEILWFRGVVVVVSAGNKGPGGGPNTVNSAPANDPFVITVGAMDEKGTPDPWDDLFPPFSAWGTTVDGYLKPEIYAPGKDIISVLAPSSEWAMEHPDRVVLDGEYFRASGTSMAAPMVTGAVALLLQAQPDLTPDQVKYRLLHTTSSRSAYPYMDVYEAVTASTTESANQGVMPHMLLAKMAMTAYWASGNGGETIDWGSVNWDSVNWDSVNWDSVNWDSVNWDSVNWDSVNWDSVNWDSVNWDSVNWDSVNWDSVNWDSVNWDSVNWDSVNWDSVTFSSVNWD